MGKTLIAAAAFDYSEVDKDTKGKLINLAGQIKNLGERWRKAGLEVAEAVHEAHKVLAGQRKGMFEKWVESEAGLSLGHAYTLKNLWERASDFPIIGKLPDTVAYLLSEPKTPEAAIKAIEKAVDKGVRPTVKMVKAEIKKHVESNGNGKANGKVYKDTFDTAKLDADLKKDKKPGTAKKQWDDATVIETIGKFGKQIDAVYGEVIKLFEECHANCGGTKEQLNEAKRAATYGKKKSHELLRDVTDAFRAWRPK